MLMMMDKSHWTATMDVSMSDGCCNLYHKGGIVIIKVMDIVLVRHHFRFIYVNFIGYDLDDAGDEV